jgi:sterol carrier protein 2
MSSRVYVAGVGMIPFTKPGASAPYHEMGAEAARLALADAGLGYDKIEQAYVGYVYGDSTCGQRALYQVGMTGIPIVNVNNNCSTGSTALFLARQAIASGALDCVLALGFEQMKPGALGAVFTDRPSAFGEFDATADKLVDAPGVPLALRYFGGAGLSHMKKYGTPLQSFAKVRAKASRHAARNPLAVFRREVTAEEVMNDQPIWPGVMTRLMACPPTCGGAAAILVSEDFASRHGLNKKVRVAAQAMTTDTASTFEAGDMMQVVGYDMAKAAASKVYEAAGVGRKTSTWSSCMTASRTTSSSPTRGWASARRAALRASSRTATTPMAAGSSPTRRAASCRRAILSAQPGLRNATS